MIELKKLPTCFGVRVGSGSGVELVIELKKLPTCFGVRVGSGSVVELVIELKERPTSPLMRVSKLAARPASRKTMCGASAPDSPKMSHRCSRWYGPMALGKKVRAWVSK
jgi:hypothetical protein